jgi:hypothetical protein
MFQSQKDRHILVHVGWMDYSFKESRFKLVKTSKQRPNSGPQTKKFETTATLENVEEQLKGIYFPCRRSVYGHESKFRFFVANYNGEKIEPFITVGEYFKERRTGQKRLYLFSRLVNMLKYSLCYSLVTFMNGIKINIKFSILLKQLVLLLCLLL